jgi:hypothetical protein
MFPAEVHNDCIPCFALMYPPCLASPVPDPFPTTSSPLSSPSLPQPINVRDQGGRRNLVLVTLFNTGALWLYAGPGSSSPTPLLAARVFPRGTNAVASALTKLQQPSDFDGSANIGARGLNAGAVDPRGFWNGGVSGTLCMWSTRRSGAGRGTGVCGVEDRCGCGPLRVPEWRGEWDLLIYVFVCVCWGGTGFVEEVWV